MATDEKTIQNSILAATVGRPIKLFRNTVGVAWHGKHVRFDRETTVTVRAGDVVIRNARAVTCGLSPNSPDLVGWMCVRVTPDMVGKMVAVMAGVEVKRPKGKPPTKGQQNFIDAITNDGGMAFAATGVGEFAEKTDEFLASLKK